MAVQQQFPFHLWPEEVALAIDTGFAHASHTPPQGHPRVVANDTSGGMNPPGTTETQSHDSPGAEGSLAATPEHKSIASPSHSEGYNPEPNSQLLEAEAQKRSRACEACRGLKVRCDFPQDRDQCKRCAKAKRKCIVTLPTRKRQRKTDSKVADLERRIDDLTATLEEQKRQISGNYRAAHAMEDEDSEVSFQGLIEHNTSSIGPKKRKSSFISDISPSPNRGFPPNMPAPIPSPNVARRNGEYSDVIDRGLLTREQSSLVFYHFLNNMARHLPVVVLPSNMTAGFVRKNSPVLFLAILCVASGQHFPEKQKALTREALKTIANRVLCTGDKALELIQAMQVLSSWHISEGRKDTTTFQLTQLACSMAISLDMNGAQLRSGLEFNLAEDKRPAASHGAHEIEQRRAWLGCFLLSGIISVPVRQLNMVRWSHYLEESINVLGKEGSLAVSDKILCLWVEIQRMSDRVAELSLCDPNRTSDLQTREELQSIIKKLKSLPQEITGTGDLSLSLYLHEAIAHAHIIYMRSEEEAVPSTKSLSAATPRRSKLKASKEGTLAGPSLSTPQIEAIKSTISFIHALLNRLTRALEQDSSITINALPSFHFSRAAYALVSLIVLHFGATAPASRLKAAIPDPVADLGVAKFLERLLSALRSSAGDETRRPLQKFQLLVKMLKAWVERARKQGANHAGPQETTPSTRTSTPRSSSARPKAPGGPRASNEQTLSINAEQLPSQPVDTGQTTPRMGYRKLSVATSQDLEGYIDVDEPMASDTTYHNYLCIDTTIVPANHTALQSPNTASSAGPLASFAHTNPWPGIQAGGPLRAATFPGNWFPSPVEETFAGPARGPLGGDGPYNPNLNGPSDHNLPAASLDLQAWSSMTLDPALEEAMGLALGADGPGFGSLVDDFLGSGGSAEPEHDAGTPHGMGGFPGWFPH